MLEIMKQVDETMKKGYTNDYIDIKTRKIRTIKSSLSTKSILTKQLLFT